MGSSLGANDKLLTEGAYRASFENVEISSSESMGLAGMHYLFEPNKYLYYGPSVYGAVTGIRGGFFVGGLNAGFKYPLYKNLKSDVGVFVGGGGGGSAPQGGGLMLKAYAGGLYEFDAGYSVGANYSYVTFPNGDISSESLSLVLDKKFETVFLTDKSEIQLFKNYNFTNNNDYLVATTQIYFPKKGTKEVSGKALTQNIKLVGVEYGVDVSDDVVGYIESAGALGGASAGYMEILGGMAYSKEMFHATSAQAKLSLGAAGGGRVNTGGGAVSKSSLALNYSPTRNIKTGIEAGYYHAFENNFDASFVKAELGLNTNFLTLSKSKSTLDFESFDSQKLNVRFSYQSYLYSENLSPRDDGANIDLMGAKLDWFLTDALYISGQAFAAFRGGAGGYATGLFGVGYIQPLVYDLSLVGEVDLGAGGGGSIETGEGSIVEPLVGLQYQLSKTVSFELMGGKIMALKGKLDANVIDASIVYSFDKLIESRKKR